MLTNPQQAFLLFYTKMAILSKHYIFLFFGVKFLASVIH